MEKPNEPGFVPDTYTESDSKELEALLLKVHEHLCKHGQVRGSDWSFNGWLPDGRAVRHKFKLGGYVRNGPTVDRERAKLGLPTPPTAEEIEAEWEKELSRSKNWRDT